MEIDEEDVKFLFGWVSSLIKHSPDLFDRADVRVLWDVAKALGEDPWEVTPIALGEKFPHKMARAPGGIACHKCASVDPLARWHIK
jgi:hypothetical protein